MYSSEVTLNFTTNSTLCGIAPESTERPRVWTYTNASILFSRKNFCEGQSYDHTSQIPLSFARVNIAGNKRTQYLVSLTEEVTELYTTVI